MWENSYILPYNFYSTEDLHKCLLTLVNVQPARELISVFHNVRRPLGFLIKYSEELRAGWKVWLLNCGLLQTALKQNWLRNIVRQSLLLPNMDYCKGKGNQHYIFCERLSVLVLKHFLSSHDFLFHLINSYTQLTHQYRVFLRNLS